MKKNKKRKKKKDFKENYYKIKKLLPFNLTKSQEKVLDEICVDLKVIKECLEYSKVMSVRAKL